jgi:hypothetical protein
LNGLRDEAQETVNLIVAYVKQETLDPVKGLGRYVLFGVAGSVALSIGLVILAVGVLRLLQTETGSTFTGNLSWIPYLIIAVIVVLVAYIAVKAVSRGQMPPSSPDGGTGPGGTTPPVATAPASSGIAPGAGSTPPTATNPPVASTPPVSSTTKEQA